MLKILFNLIIGICIILLFYVLYKKEDLTTINLEIAGKNSIELQKVIDYYKSNQEQEKLDCAYFLIQNMYGKVSVEYSFLDSTGNIMLLDTCSALKNPQAIKTIIGKGNFINRSIKSDLEHITADFLIENIELAFEVRKKYSWCKHLTKKEFYSTILPYRVKNEPLSNWRRFYYYKFKDIADSLERNHAKMEDIVFYFNKYHGKKYISNADYLLGEQTYQIVENMGGGTCDHLALNAALLFRAIGIPLNLDVIPYHGKVNGGHAYNSFTNEEKKFIYFSPYEREPERKLWIAPIVYRIRFKEPVRENVTQYYYKTTCIDLPEKNLCLATFNRGKFKKVMNAETDAGTSVFKNVACELLYFPMRERNDSLIASSTPPFIVNKEGKILYITSSPEEIISSPIIKLYDAKRILPLRNEPYVLLGWDQGWKEISEKNPCDSTSIDFGFIPNYGLFLVCGNNRMEKMQRPFIINEYLQECY
ncbi:hypothetical protein Bache_2775 [Bacteroides helcogenes P 36-108]|uniref:Transglutaminase domain-containing protein n=2 Tax=Bacteroides helcogenes TaxID=290053 RepID=E6SN65_BACT6|nr:hypothetical protein Bache_2775 [Bacteroides helcogenes P 36-108]